MPDLAVAFDNTIGMGEWQLRSGDVAFADSDLLSSVMLMLFTDRVSSDDFTPSDGDRRGWWGNLYEPHELGSRLWQLDRAKFAANTNILLQARDYTREAMQPFLDVGIASKISVDVSKIGSHGISIVINMYKPHVPNPVVFQFAYAWNQLNLDSVQPVGQPQ